MTTQLGTSSESSHANWPSELIKELHDNRQNGAVGDKLVGESDRVRIWHIDLAPGQRLPFHRHVLDYFWTAVSAGKARSYYADGSCKEFEYDVGATMHFAFAAGEEMVHNLINVGDTRLAFVTVEFKDSANRPLDLAPPGAIAGEGLGSPAGSRDGPHDKYVVQE